MSAPTLGNVQNVYREETPDMNNGGTSDQMSIRSDASHVSLRRHRQPTLSSSRAPSSEREARLQQRLTTKCQFKSCRRSGSAPGSQGRPYLRHPKYLQYTERPRKDVGKDGKPIWPPHVEDAFQNALVNIPPMGRKKRLQNGRPYGRNELIAEWIYQETGEWRDRKQVSSHIQVLSHFLKDIPEWAALMTPTEANDIEIDRVCDFYSDSIEEMIRERRKACHQPSGLGLSQLSACPELTTYPGSSHEKWTNGLYDSWMTPPESLPDVFHGYNRGQVPMAAHHVYDSIIMAHRSSPPSLHGGMNHHTMPPEPETTHPHPEWGLESTIYGHGGPHGASNVRFRPSDTPPHHGTLFPESLSDGNGNESFPPLINLPYNVDNTSNNDSFTNRLFNQTIDDRYFLNVGGDGADDMFSTSSLQPPHHLDPFEIQRPHSQP